jgi:hypothetical protein
VRKTATATWPRRQRRQDTITSLKRDIAGDSIERRRKLDKLIRLVREEMQQATKR